MEIYEPMKFKPIIADPATMFAAGLRSLNQAMALVHLGRCGLQGCTVKGLSEALESMHESSAYSVLEKLRDWGMVVHYCRQNSQGRASRYVISVKGWEVLTSVPDFSMFPDAGAVVREVVS